SRSGADEHAHIAARLAISTRDEARGTEPLAVLEQPQARAYLVTREARLAICDVDGSAAQTYAAARCREPPGRGEPAVERVVEDANVDERVDVLVGVRLSERECVLGWI